MKVSCATNPALPSYVASMHVVIATIAWLACLFPDPNEPSHPALAGSSPISSSPCLVGLASAGPPTANSAQLQVAETHRFFSNAP